MQRSQGQSHHSKSVSGLVRHSFNTEDFKNFDLQALARQSAGVVGRIGGDEPRGERLAVSRLNAALLRTIATSVSEQQDLMAMARICSKWRSAVYPLLWRRVEVMTLSMSKNTPVFWRLVLNDQMEVSIDNAFWKAADFQLNGILEHVEQLVVRECSKHGDVPFLTCDKTKPLREALPFIATSLQKVEHVRVTSTSEIRDNKNRIEAFLNTFGQELDKSSHVYVEK